MAKLKASRVAAWAASEAVQIHGGARLHARVPGGPLLLRRQGARDRRGHQRDPAPGDRPRARLLSPLRPSDGGQACGSASAMSSRSGSQARSSSGAYGGGVAAAPTRSIGASRSQKPSRATVAAISAPMPKGTTASWAISSRLVLCTDSRTGSEVERRHRAQVDHLHRDALAGQLLGGGERLVHHPRHRHHRDVGAGPHDGRPPDRHEVVGRRLRPLHPVEQPVLDEDDRVRVLDGGPQQPVGVGRGRRHHDGEAGDVGEQRLEALRVLAARRAAGAELGAHGQAPSRRPRPS